MKLKTILLFTITALAVCGCSQRSYVMSFKPVNKPDPQYQVPQGLTASSTTPDKVREPDEPRKTQSERRVSVYDSRAPQTTTTTAATAAAATTKPQSTQSSKTLESVISEPQPDPEQAPIPNTFRGNETEHIKFAYYDPFTDGTLRLNLDSLSADFCYPIDGKYSSGYGSRGRSFHSGVDLIAPSLTPIYAAFDGTVRLAKPYSGYGNVIVLRHDNGLETVYSHNAKNMVRVGEKVNKGQQIAACGRTGRASTDHLHFEVRIQGKTINPLLLINATTKTIQNGTLVVNSNPSGSIIAKLFKNNPSQPPQEEKKIVAQSSTTTAKKIDTAALDTDDTPIKIGAPASPRQSKGIRVGDKIFDAPPATAPKAKYHTIVSGDTLYSIAKRYSTTVAALCELNGITKNTVIRTDKKLRIQ